jgi:hypothetical protein
MCFFLLVCLLSSFVPCLFVSFLLIFLRLLRCENLCCWLPTIFPLLSSFLTLASLLLLAYSISVPFFFPFACFFRIALCYCLPIPFLFLSSFLLLASFLSLALSVAALFFSSLVSLHSFACFLFLVSCFLPLFQSLLSPCSLPFSFVACLSPVVYFPSVACTFSFACLPLFY